MDLTTRIKIWLGACAAATGDEDIKDAVEKSQRVLWVAQQGTSLSKNLKNATKVFEDAGKGLDAISETADKINGLCLDLRAITEIHEAIKILNQDDIIRKNPEAAANAFGQLFGGFGRLAKHLPQPAKAYSAILEGCSGEFFNSMRKKIDPNERWKPIFQQIDGYQ